MSWLGLTVVLLMLAGCTPVAPTVPRLETWSEAPRLSEPRDDFGLVVTAGQLWALGGMTGARGNVLGSVEVWDGVGPAWRSGSAMPTPRSSAGVAVIGETIYVVGGLTAGGRVTDVVEALDVRSGRWTQRAALPTRRMQLAAVALDGHVWAIGGNVGGEAFPTVEVYDPATDRWQSSTDLPTPRYSLSATVLDGRIYAVGGQTPHGVLSVVEATGSVNAGWMTLPSLPVGLTRLALVAFDGRLHSVEAGSHFTLSPGARQWDVATAPPTPRHGLAAGVLGGSLYTVGGCSEDWIDLATNEAYRLNPV